jgi:hypothetical protein
MNFSKQFATLHLSITLITALFAQSAQKMRSDSKFDLHLNTPDMPIFYIGSETDISRMNDLLDISRRVYRRFPEFLY